MKTVCIVQARMGSTRLPGKNSMELCGKSMIRHVVERVKRSKLDSIVVALPHEPETERLLKALDWAATAIVIPGDPNDLIHRYAKVAEMASADIVVRIPGDNPCIDPTEINRALDAYDEDPTPWNWLFTNLDRDVLGNGYPGGLGCEVWDARWFKWADKNVDDPRHREHPHAWAFDNRRVRTIQAPQALRRPGMDFSVNTPQDFAFINDIYQTFYPVKPDFSAIDIITYLENKHGRANRPESNRWGVAYREAVALSATVGATDQTGDGPRPATFGGDFPTSASGTADQRPIAP